MTTTPALYSLTAEYEQLAAYLQDPLEDDDPEYLNALAERLNKLGGDIQTKAVAVAGVIRELEGRAKMRKAEADRLANRAKADENNAKSLKAYLLQQMTIAGKDKIDSARFTIAIQNSPTAVTVLDAEAIPNEFKKTVITVSPDLDKIKKWRTESGEIVPGVAFMQGKHLRIR